MQWESVLQRANLFDECYRVHARFKIRTAGSGNEIEVLVLQSANGTYSTEMSHYPRAPDAVDYYRPSRAQFSNAEEALEDLVKSFNTLYSANELDSIDWIEQSE